jgi:hypothetical protein
MKTPVPRLTNAHRDRKRARGEESLRKRENDPLKANLFNTVSQSLPLSIFVVIGCFFVDQLLLLIILATWIRAANHVLLRSRSAPASCSSNRRRQQTRGHGFSKARPNNVISNKKEGEDRKRRACASQKGPINKLWFEVAAAAHDQSVATRSFFESGWPPGVVAGVVTVEAAEEAAEAGAAAAAAADEEAEAEAEADEEEASSSEGISERE